MSPAPPHAPSLRSAAPAPRPRRFVLLLLDQFTMLSFASALEAMRIANRMLGRTAYVWTLVGEGGREAVCSNGTRFVLDHGLEPGEIELDRDDVVIVMGGMDVQRATTRAVVNWLRKVARHGAAVGGTLAFTYDQK